MASEYKPNLGVISLTAATATVNADGFAGRTIALNRAAGVTVTLPAATGSGYSYDFIVGTTVTSNGYIIRVANSTDIFAGYAILSQDAGDTLVMFETAADSDTITMNGVGTGGLRGARVSIVDIAAGVFAVQVISTATGTEATVFSATV
jgi:hypothetical protein